MTAPTAGREAFATMTLLLGIPLMLAEFGIGRRGQRAAMPSRSTSASWRSPC